MEEFQREANRAKQEQITANAIILINKKEQS